MTNYSIDDGNGNQLTTGLTETEAHASAQRMADARGESVYLYSTEDGVQSRYETIEPEETEDGATEDALAALRSRAVNAVTREIMADGIRLSHTQAADLGDETMAWIKGRLGLSVTTTDRGVECRVTR